MLLKRLTQGPLNTTLMGTFKGAMIYLGREVSDPLLYGGTGHAFLINIHDAICPSGPYCWNPIQFQGRLNNLGLTYTDHGFFRAETPAEERRRIERVLIGKLDAGIPCALLNMENQLITGYDETGFHTARPWAPHSDFPPKHLTFGSWEEFGKETHVNFFSFETCDPADLKETIGDSLEYAVDLYGNPSSHTDEPYGAGPNAYIKWLSALDRGDGGKGDHGNWWNAMVWSECRKMGSGYFRLIGEEFSGTSYLATELSGIYMEISEALAKAGDKELDSMAKKGWITEARDLELETIDKIAELRAMLE